MSVPEYQVSRASAVSNPVHDSRLLERVFAHCFQSSLRTCLLGGAAEPLYQPATAVGQLHCIYYREDYFASALHEVAHWCIAGERRRQLPDYGYWYCADGRDAQAQREFERVEVKPQAIEWHFAVACNSPFCASHDNLSGATADPRFTDAVAAQARQYCQTGLPSRARAYCVALADVFAGEPVADAASFQLPDA